MDKELMDKVQKLTTALYRVTDLYPDKEPLKWTLRNDAVYAYTNLMSVKDYSDVLNAISRIIHILELASTSGFISSLNFEILKKEYIKLQESLEGRKQKALLIEPDLNKGQKQEHNGQKKIMAISGGSDERKARIREFLAKNGKKTIREIISIFDGVSEKSVQRELLDMVKSGELTAEGEKRWRIYSVAR